MKRLFKCLLKKFLPIDYLKTMMVFHHDAKRLIKYGANFKSQNKTTLEAKIILHYHVLEKGITMPKRRLPFGEKIAKELVVLIKRFNSIYGNSCQVEHAVAVLKEYYDIHCEANADKNEVFDDIRIFLRECSVGASKQLHYERTKYYSSKNKSFLEFARWRHTIRNYSPNPLDDAKIKDAVELATTAPSACNRQHIRVHCIVNKPICERILELQGGNRGFGNIADKVLIITADLRSEIAGIRERYDPYVNGGIFLMNLCYALSYYEVAHCILTCSLELEKEAKIRRLANIPENEVVVSMLCCGEPPDEFDVAFSPKRDVNEVLKFLK